MDIGETLTRCKTTPHVANRRNGVLVADDDAIFRKVLQKWLEIWGYRVIVAENGEQAWDVLQQESQPELLILDWVMPGVDGLELCGRVRERQRTPYQYILLVTAKDDTEDVVAGLEAGADDYLSKPFDRNELRARLRVGERILALQDVLMQACEDLHFQATHDVLTGIWKRGAVVDLLQREIERATRSQGSTGLLVLDLDHFKNVNDTHGHPTGDLVLREIAHRIIEAIRSYDVVGRYGGEEFLVVLPGCWHNQLFQAAERIRTAVANEPIRLQSAEIYVTVSIGATTVAPGTTDHQVLTIADNALYQAKKAGRNCTVVV
jgi:two-component system cell cycle response regulator